MLFFYQIVILGRASDKFICSDSGFYDVVERDDEIMADRFSNKGGANVDILLSKCPTRCPSKSTNDNNRMSTYQRCCQPSLSMLSELQIKLKHIEFLKVFYL